MTPVQKHICHSMLGKGRMTTNQIAEVADLSPGSVASALCYLRGSGTVRDHQITFTAHANGLACSQNKKVKDRWELI